MYITNILFILQFENYSYILSFFKRCCHENCSFGIRRGLKSVSGQKTLNNTPVNETAQNKKQTWLIPAQRKRTRSRSTKNNFAVRHP